MSETEPEVTRYFIEGLVPVCHGEKAVESYGMYLLDLMAVQGYEPVSGVSFEVVEPGDLMPAYPAGWFLLRAFVDVREFDCVIDDG